MSACNSWSLAQGMDKYLVGGVQIQVHKTELFACKQHTPMVCTCHIVYSHLDSHPNGSPTRPWLKAPTCTLRCCSAKQPQAAAHAKPSHSHNHNCIHNFGEIPPPTMPHGGNQPCLLTTSHPPLASALQAHAVLIVCSGRRGWHGRKLHHQHCDVVPCSWCDAVC